MRSGICEWKVMLNDVSLQKPKKNQIITDSIDKFFIIPKSPLVGTNSYGH